MYQTDVINSIFFLDTPFIVVGTKLDLVEKNPAAYVPESEAKRLCKHFKAAASLQCSALHYQTAGTNNVDKVFRTAITCGLKKMKIKPDSRCVVF